MRTSDDIPLTKKTLEEAASRGDLLGYRCGKCGLLEVNLAVYCPNCGSKDLRAESLPTLGRVVSFTLQHVAPEQFLNDTPYAWVIVQLDSGPRISGWIPLPPKDLKIGDKVKFSKSYRPGLVFEPIREV